MWNTAGVCMMGGGGCTQPAGSSAGLSPSPCQELTGPIREERRPHPCMLISPSEEPGSRATAGVHCHGYSSSSSPTVLPEQVNQAEGIWCLGVGGTRLDDLQLHHCFLEQSKDEAKALTHSFFWEAW